jgi:hypothetical protein
VPHRYTRQLSFYLCHSTTPVGLAVLVNIICTRWKIEEDFQGAKGLAGLDLRPDRAFLTPSPAREGPARSAVKATKTTTGTATGITKDVRKASRRAASRQKCSSPRRSG